MSISSALQTGVSGLRANSKAVGSISENIANSNTVGYRRGFAQMVTTTASGGSAEGVLSVEAVKQVDIATAGGLISTNSPTDLAIGGNGFFAVSLNPNDKVQTNYMLTRAGSFLPDEQGNLKNAAGYFLPAILMAWTVRLGRLIAVPLSKWKRSMSETLICPQG